MYTHIHIYIYTHMCVYLSLYIYVYIHIYIYIYIHRRFDVDLMFDEGVVDATPVSTGAALRSCQMLLVSILGSGSALRQTLFLLSQAILVGIILVGVCRGFV